MGRQIDFFLHQDDQADFDTLIKNIDNIILLPYYHYNNKISTIKDTIIRDLNEEGNRVYLVREKNLKDIKLKHIENFGYWLVDDNSLPVIHFDRSITIGGTIKRGRLYFTTDYFNTDKMTTIKKPDDFIKWADNVIKTVRRKLIKQKHVMGSYTYTEYLGQHACKWKEYNRAEITAAGHELKSMTVK